MFTKGLLVVGSLLLVNAGGAFATPVVTNTSTSSNNDYTYKKSSGYDYSYENSTSVTTTNETYNFNSRSGFGVGFGTVKGVALDDPLTGNVSSTVSLTGTPTTYNFAGTANGSLAFSIPTSGMVSGSYSSGVQFGIKDMTGTGSSSSTSTVNTGSGSGTAFNQTSRF